MGAAAVVIGAQATMAAVSAVGQHKAAGAQANVSKAGATLQHAQQEFELSKQAAIASEEFRRNVATSTALAGYRGVSGRQVAGESFSAYARDIEAINRGYSINDIQKQNQLASIKATKSTGQFGAVMSFGQSVLAPATAGAWQSAYPSLYK